MNCKTLFITVLTIFSFNACAEQTASPKGAVAYIISPAHGEIVHNPVTVKFGLRGMGIAPIGEPIPNTGHFHLLVDEQKLPPLDQPLHFGEHYLHFSDGHTETTLELTPGKHTLQLIMGDAAHTPHKPAVISEKIEITVKEFSGFSQ